MIPSRKLVVSLGIVIAALVVVSPVGSSLVSGIEEVLSSGMSDLSLAFQTIYPAATDLGATPASTQVSVGLGLPISDPAGLNAFIQASSTPGSPGFRQFLTPSQFTATYSPSLASYRALQAYFAPYGVQLQPESNRLILTVSGSPAAVGAAFHTTFHDYRMPNGQVYFGPTSAPVVPTSLGVTAAYGFTDATYNVPANLLQKSAPATPSSAAASCTTNGNGDTTGYNPTQILDAYGVNTLHSANENGNGIKIGIVDAYDSGITAADLKTWLNDFDSDCGVAAATVSYNYPIPSTTLNSSASSGWGGEEVLDMDWSHTMAPNATMEMTFSPNSGNGLYQAVDWLVAGAFTNTISLSWGEPDVGISGGTSCSFECNASTDGSYAILHPIIQAAVAEGISVFVASGDCGAADGTNTASTDYPASDEDSTGVGGTIVNITTDTYTSEYAWSGNESGSSCDNGGGAGGGWAPTPQPWFQHGYGVSNKGLRGAPDVGITAGSWLDVYCDSNSECGGTSIDLSAGTSDAAPMWSGLTAVADQIHGGGLGLIDPILYSILRSGTGYNNSFHQITTGGNGYLAHAGWEPISGVGTPKANVAIPAIAAGGYPPPQSTLAANLTASVVSGAAPLKVTFTAKATGGSGTYPLYDFQFGDGNATPSKTNSYTYSYTKDGAYAANVEVYDSKGNSTASTFVLISVGTTPFTIGLAASTTTPTVSQSVTFTATPTGGTSPYTLTYEYGDGTTSANPTSSTTSAHSFGAAGTYCAQVTATDGASPAAGAVSNVVTLNVGGASGTCSGSSTSGPTISSFTATPSSFTLGNSTTLAVTASGGVGPLSYAYTGLPSPCATSNASSITCKPTATGGPYTITVTVSDSAKTPHTATATTSFTVTAAGGPTISSFTDSPASIPLGGTSYFNVTATGGTKPYTYVYNNLPSLCASSNVTSLACAPAAAGTYTGITVTVTDAHKLAVTSNSVTLDVTSSSAPTVAIPTPSPTSVDVGGTVTFSTTASGGSGTGYVYTWTPSSTSLGCGSSTSSTLSCTPTAAGTSYTVSVLVKDSKGDSSSTVPSAAYTVLSDPAATTPSPSTASIDLGQSVTFSTVASGGTSSYSYTWTPSSTNFGCATSTTASITCTPTAAGSYTVSVQVKDTNNGLSSVVPSASYTVHSRPAVTTPSPSVSSVAVGGTVSFSTTPSGGTGTYSSYAWTQSSSALGCTLGTTSSISCTPTAAGTSYTVSVSVKDSNGEASPTETSASFTVTSAASGSPSISLFYASPNPVTVNSTTTLNVVVTGGASPYTFAYVGLPQGCSSQNASTVSCTPTEAGNYSTVSVTVTDTAGNKATASTWINVVKASSGSTSSSSGQPSWLLYAIVGAIFVVAVIVVLLATRKKSPPPSHPVQPWKAPPASPSATDGSWVNEASQPPAP